MIVRCYGTEFVNKSNAQRNKPTPGDDHSPLGSRTFNRASNRRGQRRTLEDIMPGPTFQKQAQLNTTQLSRHDSTATFTPKFINTLNKHDSRATDSARDLAEFSGKRWVWLKDTKFAFVKGWVTEENESTFQVRCDNESVDRTVDKQDVDKVNPPKFNLADDMADLTYLNEASVIHNLRQRYEADLIYVGLAQGCADVDLLWTLLGHRQSVPEYPHLWLRLCRIIQRETSRRHKTSYLCYLRHRISRHVGNARESINPNYVCLRQRVYLQIVENQVLVKPKTQKR
jgi:hypothetical protein